jgi:hypothetical protein
MKAGETPLFCTVNGSLYQVWGDGYAEYVGEDDTARRNEPPCAECGATERSADCHRCPL